MASYIGRRLIVNVGVFFVITIAIFSLVHIAPGDPVQMMIPPDQFNASTEAFIEAQRHRLGLDQPLPIQYLSWLGNALQGDLGYSISTSRPVGELLLERAVPTVELMGLALFLSIVIAVPLGLLAAVHRNRVLDYIISTFSMVAISTPPFFFGIIAIYVVSLKLGLLPSAGMASPSDGSTVDLLRHLILPVSILGIGGSGPLIRYVRSSALNEINSEYVRTAVAKGASPMRVIGVHVLRNAMIPIVTVVALSLPGLLAGAVLIEQIFAWPGMGQLAVTAVARKDYPVIIGFAVLVSLLVLAANLLADILYTVVDPRVSLR
ncbi:ABC transporter permease [Brachybacterium huguangmaarense]